MDTSAHIDLKCKEKVTDSDTESVSDVESSFHPFSPVKGSSDAFRPKPLKIPRYAILHVV